MIRLRPRGDTHYLAQGRTVFATGRDGFINPESEQGLFVHETRMLSCYRYLINGESPTPVALSNAQQYSWLGYYVIKTPGVKVTQPDTGSGLVDPASENTIELRLSRYAGGGMHEDVDLTNYSLQSSSFTLEIEVGADFADQIEVRSWRQQQGTLGKEWREVSAGVWELIFDYHIQHEYDVQGNSGTASIHRSLTLQVENASSPPNYIDGILRFQVELEPRGQWHACINMIAMVDGEKIDLVYRCRSFGGINNEFDRRRLIFLNEATDFSTPESDNLSSVVVGALEQAKQDLASLRLVDLDERSWTVGAGFPVYVALFGRDVLTAAWQAALASPDMLKGTPAILARYQGQEINDWRDEQPGRMLHEAHTGPLEAVNYNPRWRYYGSITTSEFYPVVISELWHWTGDKELVKPLIDPMMRSLRWLDEFSDLDGDGSYEYKTRSIQGTRHQAWKDSRDGIVYPDGTQVEPPIATCEEQGFVYLAKLHASEVLWWLDERELARQLFQEASELKDRFNAAFWMEDLSFYAMGLDSENNQIRSVGSNLGHLLATGITDGALVRPTANRMFEMDLFSGWGIRTLSTNNPANNPYSYLRGSVWPVEQATFAIGFMRYGLHNLVEKISLAQFEAAMLFDFYRLPEVFSGHGKDEEHPFPSLYPQTNWPQAWSASAVSCWCSRCWDSIHMHR